MRSVLRLFLGVVLVGNAAMAGIIQYGNPSSVILVRSLPRPNPTLWIFPVPIDRVRQVMEKNRYSGLLSGWVVDTSPKDLSDSRARVLEQAGNEHDGYMRSRPGDASVDSKVYFLPDRKPCIFGVEMHLHLTAVDADHTKVEIIPHRAWVYAGERDRGVFPLFWHRQGIFVKVRPTTIQEYTVLRNLGLALGESSMPAVMLPDPDAPLKEYRYTDKEIIDLDAPNLYQLEWSPAF
jgi:hypothetical protein